MQNSSDSKNSEAKFVWKPRRFKYKLDAKHRQLKSTVVPPSEYHPLKPITVTGASFLKATEKSEKDIKEKTKASSESEELENKSSPDFIDPLSALLSDPLSAPTPVKAVDTNKQKEAEKEIANDEDELVNDDGFVPWSSRDFVKATVTAREAREMPKRYQPGVSMSEKLKDRLGELDDLEEGGFIEMQNLTQQEFIQRIDMLKRTLTHAWNENQKVKALKIAIQCSKLLGSVAVIPFYPSKFVLVTELLNTFGSLVFKRILTMCPDTKAENIDLQKVPEAAREICTNWLLKIASIRELLPRLYIEAATLHCNKFLLPGDCKTVLIRLTEATRGVGDPLVAVYLRTYLCRVGRLHLPGFKGHLKSNLYDFISSYKQIHTTPVQNVMAEQKLDMATYLRHYTPALEWILSCLAHKAREATLSEVTDKCKNSVSSLLLFNCCISSFNAQFVASRALTFASTINQSQDKLFPKYVVYRSLGVKVAEAAPSNDDRLPLLNDVWKVLTKIRNPEHYIACVEVWAEFVAKNFTRKELNTVLNDVIKHMTPDRAFEMHYDELHSIVVKILEHTSNFTDLFSMEKFLPFLDLFQKEEKKVDVCKEIAEAFCKKNIESTTSDPITISGLIYICKAMHDSINALSLDDDRKSVSSLVSSVLLKITFGKDFEQQLNFYVECRASFHGLDAVVACLVHAVNTLSTRVSSIVKGKHTRKTAAFVRACTAYAFITIPSLSNIHTRLSLYLESGQAALISQCLTQADAIYKAAISMLYDLATIRETKRQASQQQFTNYVVNFLSSLLTVPDNTEQGVLLLLRGLLNVISQSKDTITPHAKCMIYIKVLSLLTAYSQEQYLYRVDRVDSNETMYSNDNKFLAEIAKVSATVLDEILAYLATTKHVNEQKEQSSCAFHLFETIIAHGDMDDRDMQHLAIVVWNAACREGVSQTKPMVRLREYLKERGGVYQSLASSLQLQSRA